MESTTVSALVAKAAPTPQRMKEIVSFVCKLRPETAPETVRARVYDAVQAGKMFKVTRGVYVGLKEGAALVVVNADGWAAIEAMDEESLDLLITDNPWDYGTKQNVGKGTTRPHAKMGGRSYQQKDFDEAFLRAAFRALKKTTHQWRNLATGQPRPGPGAFVFLTPKPTKQTRRRINSLIDLAESIGFVYQGVTHWDMDTMGMGYAFGRSQVNHLHLMTAGERGGVGWELGMRDITRAKSVRNPAKPGAEKHEAQKPPEVFLDPITFCCRPGDVVMDPFAGDPTWAEKAVEMGYNVILGDLDPKWTSQIAATHLGGLANPDDDSTPAEA